MKTTMHFLEGGSMYEVLTFANGIQETYGSSFLHKVSFVCNEYGLNFENWQDFRKAVDILKNKI